MFSFAENEIEGLRIKVAACNMIDDFDEWKSKISNYQQNNSDAIPINKELLESVDVIVGD